MSPAQGSRENFFEEVITQPSTAGRQEVRGRRVGSSRGHSKESQGEDEGMFEEPKQDVCGWSPASKERGQRQGCEGCRALLLSVKVFSPYIIKVMGLGRVDYSVYFE
jgi:hypothetical protein